MKRFGIIGGLSARETAFCAEILHAELAERCDAGRGPELLTYSLNPQEVRRLVSTGDWPRLVAKVANAAEALVGAGAGGLLLASSSLHIAAQQVELIVAAPVWWLTDPVIEYLREERIYCAVVIGTRCLPEEEIWRARMRGSAAIRLVLPLEEDRELVARIIDCELAYGVTRESSRVELMRLMVTLKNRGAEAIILAAPELSLLIEEGDVPLPLFCATRQNIRRAVAWAVVAETEPTRAP